MSKAYDELCRWERERATLCSVGSLLGWDERTYLPAKGRAFRGEQLALVARMNHERLIAPRLGELLAEAEGGTFATDSLEGANLRGIRRARDRAVKVPTALVEALARATSAGQNAWESAKEQDDFPAFQQHLKTIVQLKREEAQAVGYAEHPYDALVDEFEPGATTAQLRVVFAELQKDLTPFIAALTASGRQGSRALLEREYPVESQRWLCERVARQVGFDLEGGRLDVTVHPFCSGIGPGDVRITTRYNARAFAEAFFGTLHEAGHGIYEQNLDADQFGLPCGTACSLGIHESQSRLWENFVGRSRPFWEYCWPMVRKAFPGALGDVTMDSFYFAINMVQPSFIRIEADEATYNLHITLRFELEQALVSGDLSVGEVPGAWNARFKELFGLEVPSDQLGCLQDVHWSAGLFGYFPTYTLGNLYAAQFMVQARSELSDLDGDLQQGSFDHLREWLREKVHRWGQRYAASDLCKRITGQKLGSTALMDYLRTKLGRLYGIADAKSGK